MNHAFNTEIAKEYGIHQAILLEYLWYWIGRNEKANKNSIDGKTWTYNSIKSLHHIFPYLSERQISNALKSLESEGLIMSGNHNKSAYDRTKWYTFTQKGKSIMQKSKMEKPEKLNGLSEGGEPIPIKKNNKKTYGKYNHVRLKDEEIDELKAQYHDWMSKVQNLDDYIEMTGKRYVNHFLTIKKWANNKKEEASSGYEDTKLINYDE